LDTAGNFWLVGLFCTALGALIGYAVAMMFGPGNSKTRDLEGRLQQARDDLKNYRMEVNTHFTQTADLLNRMTDSYREVHNHLARSAQTLCDRPGQAPLLNALPEASAQGTSAHSLGDVYPPLDYAPKATQSERGILREDFDLDKPTLSYDPPISADYHLDDDELDNYTGLSQSRN
jgi:hypothetical protein